MSGKEVNMIKPSIMYSVICDRCGRILEDGAFWEDESSAITYALNSKWVEIGDKHYCPDCAKNLAMN